jgi:hypothetical protein
MQRSYSDSVDFGVRITLKVSQPLRAIGFGKITIKRAEGKIALLARRFQGNAIGKTQSPTVLKPP